MALHTCLIYWIESTDRILASAEYSNVGPNRLQKNYSDVEKEFIEGMSLGYEVWWPGDFIVACFQHYQ